LIRSTSVDSADTPHPTTGSPRSPSRLWTAAGFMARSTFSGSVRPSQYKTSPRATWPICRPRLVKSSMPYEARQIGTRSDDDLAVAESASGRVSRASPVHTALRNCTGDEGGPFGFDDQVVDPKPPRAAVVKSHGRERRGNVGTMISAGMIERGERKRTASEASKAV